VKTYQIELQRIKGMQHSHGVIDMQVDAIVQAVPPQADDGAPSTKLSLNEANARVLLSLLKAQLMELDKRKARSQR
jgi:hypothetical protein